MSFLLKADSAGLFFGLDWNVSQIFLSNAAPVGLLVLITGISNSRSALVNVFLDTPDMKDQMIDT